MVIMSYQLDSPATMTDHADLSKPVTVRRRTPQQRQTYLAEQRARLVAEGRSADFLAGFDLLAQHAEDSGTMSRSWAGGKQFGKTAEFYDVAFACWFEQFQGQVFVCHPDEYDKHRSGLTRAAERAGYLDEVPLVADERRGTLGALVAYP